MKRQFIVFCFILLLPGCFYVPAGPQPPENATTVKEFEGYLQSLVDFGTPQGISFVVVKNDKIVYSNGFGWADRPNQIKATPESVYHWFSITKIVTAIAILQLQEKGKLNLNDPVVSHLPWFLVHYPSDTSKIITVLNLLNHSSGLPDAGMDLIKWVYHEGRPPANQTDFLKEVLPDYSTLIFEPGERSQYTNIGYMVLGAIIEKVSGQSYEDYVRKNILIPLKMMHTDFVYTKEMEPNEAAGEHPLADMMTPIIPVVLPTYIREIQDDHIWLKRFYTYQTPPTALIGPATDAARLAMAYLNMGELDGQRILLEKSVNIMTTEGYITRGDSSSSFRGNGISWFIFRENGKLMIKHEGGGLGFRTVMQLYPESKLAFIMFTNDVKTEIWKIMKTAAKIEW